MFESLKELKQKCGKGIKEPFIMTYFYRPISLIVTWFVVRTPITANQITTLMVLTSLLAVFLFIKGDYLYSLTGSALLLFSFVLDCADGQVARYRGVISLVFHRMVDGILSIFVYTFIFLFIPLGIYHTSGNYIPFIFGFTVVTSNFLYERANFCMIKLSWENKIPDISKTKEKKILKRGLFSILFRLIVKIKNMLANILSYNGMLFVLFIFAIINRLEWFLIFYSVFYTLRLFAYVAIQLKKYHFDVKKYHSNS